MAWTTGETAGTVTSVLLFLALVFVGLWLVACTTGWDPLGLEGYTSMLTGPFSKPQYGLGRAPVFGQTTVQTTPRRRSTGSPKPAPKPKKYANLSGNFH